MLGEERIAPVVMVTAFSQASYVEQAAAAGAMAYIVKPFSRATSCRDAAGGRRDSPRPLRSPRRSPTSPSASRRARSSIARRACSWRAGMSEPEAFRRLQRLAMDKRKTLREVAEAVVLASEAEK